MYTIQKAARLIITLAVLLGADPARRAFARDPPPSFLMPTRYYTGWLEENPAQQVAVIVQKTGAGHGAEQAATQLGGKVTKDLHIINAFAAQMKAGAARQLGGQPGCALGKPGDAPVQSSASPKRFTTWATKLGTGSQKWFHRSCQ